MKIDLKGFYLMSIYDGNDGNSSVKVFFNRFTKKKIK